LVDQEWMDIVKLKRTFPILILLALFCTVLTVQNATAQVVHSANKQQLTLTVGAMGSAFQPDYSATTGVSRDASYLFGVGTYVDLGLSRWLQFEAEGRWSRFNSSENTNENNYLVGMRLPVQRRGRFTPYAKALVGMNTANFLNGNAFSVSLGGGVDYKLNKRFSLRAGDFEYQIWRTTPSIQPYGFSVGMGYKVF
jgi:hypothetical protein